MQEKEKLIKEQRIRDASRNNFLGLEGKFGTILKYLGHSITIQGYSLYNSTPMPDFYDLEEDSMPVLDMDEENKEIGMYFYGLSYGMDIEIKYINEDKILSVKYNNNIVYCEIMNDLQSYVPSQEWETKINSLYKIAKKKEDENQVNIKETNKKIKMNMIEMFLDRLKRTWGN